MCPICDHPLHKQHSRDHVAWHFMEELKAYIIDPSKCPECSYMGDKLESVARHLALYHQKLDQFLSDTDLVAEKRAKAMAKPKKVNGSRIFSLFAPDATGLAAEMVEKNVQKTQSLSLGQVGLNLCEAHLIPGKISAKIGWLPKIVEMVYCNME